MGLLSDIWDSIVSKIQALIDAALEKFKTWVHNTIKAAIDAVDWVINHITNFIDNSITYVNESINYWGDQITQYIDRSIHYIDESINYWGDQITQHTTNVIGASKDWVTNQLAAERSWTRSFFKLSDPMGFLKNPWGYIEAAFDVLIKPWGHGIVKAFWEGLEEGLGE